MKATWKIERFEDCIEKVTYTPKIQRKDFLNVGKYPVVSQEEDFINGYWNREADLFRAKTPVVVFGDHTKILKYVDFAFVLGADGVKILQPQAFLLPKFFFYQLHTASLDSLGYARHYRLLKELKIAYPPLPEQQRIVALLDEAFDGIATAKANAEKNRQNARALFESHLQAVFSQRGEGWVDSSLGDVLAVLRNGLNCKQDKTGKGSKISRIESIWNAKFDLSRVSYAELPEYQKVKFRLQKGDVLFSHINSAVHVGKTALFDIDEEVIHGVNLLLMRTAPNMLSAYLDLYLKFIFACGYWRGVCKQSVNQASVNQQDITRVPIHFPGLKVQSAIVEQTNSFASETQRLEGIYRQKIAALDELKKSLLHQAFSGEMTFAEAKAASHDRYGEAYEGLAG